MLPGVVILAFILWAKLALTSNLVNIHKGKKSKVFLKTDPRTGRQSILKVIPADHRAAYEREVNALQTIRSDYIPKLISAYRYGTDFAIEQELIRGQTIKQMIFKSDPPRKLPKEFIAKVIAQVLQALHQLHQQGWTHADIFHENVMVTSDGDVRLLDLGSAIPKCTATTGIKEAVGSRFSDPGMMWIGKVVGERELGMAVDYYAVGTLLKAMWLATEDLDRDSNRVGDPDADQLLGLLMNSDRQVRWMHLFTGFEGIMRLPFFTKYKVDWSPPAPQPSYSMEKSSLSVAMEKPFHQSFTVKKQDLSKTCQVAAKDKPLEAETMSKGEPTCSISKEIPKPFPTANDKDKDEVDDDNEDYECSSQDRKRKAQNDLNPKKAKQTPKVVQNTQESSSSSSSKKKSKFVPSEDFYN